MVKILRSQLHIILLVALGLNCAHAEDALELLSPDSALSNFNGPVSNAIENLAFNMVSIADEIAVQANGKFARTSDMLLGSIETLITNALERLALPILQASRKLSQEICQTSLTIHDLRASIDLQLSNCTEDLNDLLRSFKSEAEESILSIEGTIDEVVNLAKTCHVLGDSETGKIMSRGFATSTNCFVERIVSLNEEISKELETVALLLSRTGEVSQQSESQALACIDELVKEVTKRIEEDLKDC
ncbi:unnamed protein product [Ceratitis capitata]|uniref:(Mediterranean fruit fly) hypothetical protein n=1 Tax=Ceratitis capitata TaxID=7213 RepID=A0A811U069_CERCA|nr:unnamed protein product [Ceratitis capitata]